MSLRSVSKSCISFYSTLSAMEYPTSDLFQLKLLPKGISRIKQHVPKKAAPITPDILKKIFIYLNFDISFDIVYGLFFF